MHIHFTRRQTKIFAALSRSIVKDGLNEDERAEYFIEAVALAIVDAVQRTDSWESSLLAKFIPRKDIRRAREESDSCNDKF